MYRVLIKIISFFVVISLLLYPCRIAAQDDTSIDIGNFTIVQIGEEAPFSGYLFDPLASSKILSQYKYDMAELQLQFEYERQRIELKASIDLQLKDVELLSLRAQVENGETHIEYLEKQLRKTPDKYAPWIFIGGVVIGMLITLGSVRLAVGD